MYFTNVLLMSGALKDYSSNIKFWIINVIKGGKSPSGERVKKVRLPFCTILLCIITSKIPPDLEELIIFSFCFLFLNHGCEICTFSRGICYNLELFYFAFSNSNGCVEDWICILKGTLRRRQGNAPAEIGSFAPRPSASVARGDFSEVTTSGWPRSCAITVFLCEIATSMRPGRLWLKRLAKCALACLIFWRGAFLCFFCCASNSSFSGNTVISAAKIQVPVQNIILT